MSSVNGLIDRIRGEFAASQEKLKQFQQQQTESHHARLQRAARLESTLDELRAVWRPRLEALAHEFGERVQAQPVVKPGQRQVEFQVQSQLATIRLRFAATSDADVTKLVLTYDLEILPILMQFERHAEMAFPLEQVDQTALASWLDDRIVGFVKTYLALHENEYYLKDHLVEDPVAHVRFPKFAAGATRQQHGRTTYFISEETAAEFDRRSQ